MNSRSASIVGDQQAGGSSSFAWCNRQWLSSQALTRRSSGRLKLAVFDHNLLCLPESNGYPHCRLASLPPATDTVCPLCGAQLLTLASQYSCPVCRVVRSEVERN